ncbi:hypothetical protein L3556_09005 [Candidatus Synechococcus calcipolaris G9]|uniref:Uncharacterized protein n=1 Tax=Candidatus Synechococcus calcipolaris G9 TaxID=1497997 RepID=A0ABT6EZM8_9SYNE|nr:hypothetical protein [Candidatus Synechococcus calcipolaris]MDG2991061.1 hypothetical protein [Candidatus Synechococcus calcipolaris G9]
MATWEFLLQKEGDRAWLPLEPPSVEILEGCYRLMARCPSAETPIEVQIKHYYEQEGQPKQRYQRRTHRTSPSGLMGIIPFTYLEPGRWELSCRLTQEGVIQGGTFEIRLDVLAQVEDWDWMPTIPVTATEEPPVMLSAGLPEEESWSGPSESRDIAAPAIPVLESSPESDVLVPITQTSQKSVENLTDPQPLDAETAQQPTQPATLITLPQCAYTVFSDESLTIRGQVLVPGTVVIRLRNPLTREVILEDSIEPVGVAPNLEFAYEMPQLTHISVVVGEARVIPTTELGRSEIRQSQAFMVTILAAPDLPLASTAPKPKDESKSTIPVKPLQSSPVIQTPVSPAQPLPLHPPKPPRSPLDQPLVKPLASPPLLPRRRSPELPVLAPVQLTPSPSPGITLPPRLGAISESKRQRRVSLPTFCQPLSVVDVPVTPPPFSSAGSQERFWSNLQRLAQVEASQVGYQNEDGPIAEDFPLLPPILTLPEADMVANESMEIRVKLSQSKERVCVKLWVTNAETGDLIAGPRWLVDFDFQDNHSERETIVRIDIPSDAQALAIMAIAVNQDTCQESPTVALRRSVIKGR